jgi:tetratricopeptide (TPR) repeat protein
VEFLIPDSGWSTSALTDDQGRFEISDLAQGSYHVTVVAPGCGMSVTTAEVRGRTGPLLLTLQKIETPASPRNDYVVSSQELALGDKGQKSFNKGVRLLLNGQIVGSMPYFTRAIAQNPRHYRAYYNLGLAQLRLGQMENAQRSLQRAVDLSGGGFAPAQFLMGVVLCQQQDYRHAESVIQRGLELEPGSATGKYFLGLAQLALGRIADAEKSATQALSRREDLAEAYFLLARIHESGHNAPGMIADLQSYLKLEPDGPASNQARNLLEHTQSK